MPAVGLDPDAGNLKAVEQLDFDNPAPLGRAAYSIDKQVEASQVVSIQHPSATPVPEAGCRSNPVVRNFRLNLVEEYHSLVACRS